MQLFNNKVMKKSFKLIAVLFLILMSSCSGPEGPPGLDGKDGLIAQVFELKNVNFGYSDLDGYTISNSLIPSLYPSDVLLIYRMSSTISSSTPVWQLIPRTLFVPQGELDYDYDFSKEDFVIYAGGNYDLSTTPSYLNNQTFRIVIVPGSFSASINKNNYNEVLAALNLSDSQVQRINF